jgi:hypothetical protein
MGADVDNAHAREKEHATDQKQWAGDCTVKSAISKPVGEAADGHSEKARSRRRLKRAPIESYDAQHSPRHDRDYKPVADRCWRAATSFHLPCHCEEDDSTARFYALALPLQPRAVGDQDTH